MKPHSKEAMQKYLTFRFWTRHLREQRLLSEQEYCRILSAIQARLDG